MEGLIKRHDAFESLLSKQQVKLQNMQEFGDKLLKQRHFDSKNVGETVETVTQRRDNIKAMSDDRKKTLQDSLLYAQFNRDCLEVILMCYFYSNIL